MERKKSKITTIRFNQKELDSLNQMGHYLGLDSTSQIIKCCLPYAKQRIDSFLNEFADVIQPLKKTEIDSLILTMSIIAKRKKQEEKSKINL